MSSSALMHHLRLRFALRGPGRPACPKTSLFACATLVLVACNETPSSTNVSASGAAGRPGFEATITGAYEGEVSGRGVLELLPEAGFEKRGYYFLADGQGLRPHGITFVLPRRTGPGVHALESPSPLDIGTVPSVRVDRDLGNAVASADRNTSGTLELTATADSQDEAVVLVNTFAEQVVMFIDERGAAQEGRAAQRAEPVIRRGDQVQLVALTRSFSVSTFGVAEQDGAPGDRIRVRREVGDRRGETGTSRIIGEVLPDGRVALPGFN